MKIKKTFMISYFTIAMLLFSTLAFAQETEIASLASDELEDPLFDTDVGAVPGAFIGEIAYGFEKMGDFFKIAGTRDCRQRSIRVFHAGRRKLLKVVPIYKRYGDENSDRVLLLVRRIREDYFSNIRSLGPKCLDELGEEGRARLLVPFDTLLNRIINWIKEQEKAKGTNVAGELKPLSIIDKKLELTPAEEQKRMFAIAEKPKADSRDDIIARKKALYQEKSPIIEKVRMLEEKGNGVEGVAIPKKVKLLGAAEPALKDVCPPEGICKEADKDKKVTTLSGITVTIKRLEGIKIFERKKGDIDTLMSLIYG